MGSDTHPDRSFEQRIESLRQNRVSGALDLVLEALDLADDWLGDGRPAAELAAELRGMHPAMATVANVARLLDGAGSGLAIRVVELRNSLREGNRRIAENLRSVIPGDSKIITLSNSSTVREALVVLKPAHVYVMQSLPGGEGEKQAEALRDKFVKVGVESSVGVIADSTLANVVPLVDCALVGIDSYDSEGSILHKVGTAPLALCCRYFGKPFYAAGHSLKRVPRRLRGPAGGEAGPVDPMFDCTPGSLVARIVTEKPLD